VWPPHEELAPTSNTNATPSAATSSCPAKPPPPPQPTMVSPPHTTMTTTHLYTQIAIPLEKNYRRLVEMATIYRFCGLDLKMAGEMKRSVRGGDFWLETRERKLEERKNRGEKEERLGQAYPAFSAYGKPKMSSVGARPKTALRSTCRSLRPTGSRNGIFGFFQAEKFLFGLRQTDGVLFLIYTR
jgi:hypothetical protein